MLAAMPAKKPVKKSAAKKPAAKQAPPNKAAASKPAAKKPSSSAPATKGEVVWTDLRPLLGKPTDDPEVLAVLARAGLKWGRPDGGDSYAAAKKSPFEVLARRADAGTRGSPLLVHTIFLYGTRADSPRTPFSTPPYGLRFASRAELLSAMPPPARTWCIGKGEVPVDAPKVSHDRWELDGVRASAQYDAVHNCRSIQVSVLD